LQRRTFFKASFTLAAVLIAWRQGVLVPAEKIRSKIAEFEFLNRKDIQLLQYFLPVVLPFQKWTVEEVSSFSSRLDMTISLMTPKVQGDIRQLFDLFDLKPVVWFYGLASIESASVQKRSQLLSSLKKSRLKDFRAAANGFCELLSAVHYSNPDSYKDLGYEAPLELL
tara:strand:- start:53 stop:556 length:504 start_codon:yes stop_codon:yes gene_type:complete